MEGIASHDLSGGGVDEGRVFYNAASGRWAGEQMARAAAEGRPLNASVLRTNDTLLADEWRIFDQSIVQAATIQLRGVADLISAGLVRPVANSLGKTLLSYEKMGFMDPATVSMDGVTRTEMDRLEFELASLPLPITHKDWYLNLRTLTASRTRGEPLDTAGSRIAGTVVGQMAEQMLFQGGKVFVGVPIYGYTTHPNRNTMTFGTNGNWVQAAKTGTDILNDVLAMISASVTARQYGPWVLYVPRNSNVGLDADFKANSTLTIRQRLLQIDGLQKIQVVDQLPANNVVLVQMSEDTVVWVQGEPLQTVQWDIQGGFHINFKAFQIGVPLVRADINARSGIVHMS